MDKLRGELDAVFVAPAHPIQCAMMERLSKDPGVAGIGEEPVALRSVAHVDEALVAKIVTRAVG